MQTPRCSAKLEGKLHLGIVRIRSVERRLSYVETPSMCWSGSNVYPYPPGTIFTQPCLVQVWSWDLHGPFRLPCHVSILAMVRFAARS